MSLLSILSFLTLQIPQDSVLRLPIRFHLLHSASSLNISTRRTVAAVDSLVAFANTIWRQAGIEWVVESVVREDAPRAALLDSMIDGSATRTSERLIGFVPRDKILRDGWNVFLIQDFGSIGGVMFRPELPGIVLAERGYGYELPAAGRGGATLAQGLGYSLTLSHRPCDDTHNIMANGCSRPGALSTLNAEQIEAARRQAQAGHPTSVMPSP